jgi:hypothetical protein
VGFIVVCVVLLLLAGSAWADADSVAEIIEDYGLNADVSGQTITVTGSKTDATTTLELGDISGLTIDLQAELTATLTATMDNWQGGNLNLITANGNGNFNIKNGGKIKLLDPSAEKRAPEDPYPRSGWPRMVRLEGATVTVETGAELELTTAKGSAISHYGKLKINGGTVFVPHGNIGDGDLEPMYDIEIQDSAIDGLNGLANLNGKYCVFGGLTYIADDGSQGNGDGSFELVVAPNATLTFTRPNSGNFGPGVTLSIDQGGTLVIDSGASFELDGTLVVNGKGVIEENATLVVVGTLIIRPGGEIENHGTIIVDGTIINYEYFKNHGTIINKSNTIRNYGTITNTGTIDNESAGVIINEEGGTIDNTNGTINNEGTIKSDSAIENVDGNDVQPVATDSSSGGGGGCNAGYGIIGLLLAGIVTRKYRKA